jgi:DNA-binding NarL/FixJ family response regulator
VRSCPSWRRPAQVDLKLKVLIIEDSPEIAAGISDRLLQSGQCEIVGHAASEQLALDWSFQNEGGFDVAILDLLLPEGSGFGVLAHMSKYQPGKVVVLSEYVSPVMAERCKAAGAVAAFPKSKMSECLDFVLGLAGERQH